MGFLFCLTGSLQAAWLSGTPNYPLDRATFNYYAWGSGSLAFLVLAIVLAVLLRKTRRPA